MFFTRDHVFRIIRPEDFGTFPPRITETEATWTGRSVPLPHMDDRHSPAQYAGLALWLFELPHASLLTERYALGLCDLRDIKGAPPAVKHKPDNTHEIALYAVSPDTTEEEWARGEWRALVPVNYVEQFQTPYPHVARWITERAAEAIVNGRFVIEPQGVTGARKFFRQSVEEWVRQAGRIFDSRGPKPPKPGQPPADDDE